MQRLSNGCLDVVVRGVQGRILSGDYAIESRLPTEAQLQIEWGVSRSVVREAMKMLASQGLVRIEQGRGTFVSAPDSQPLRQQLEWTLQRAVFDTSRAVPDEWDALLDVRLVLEVGAAQRAAQRAGEVEMEAMALAIAQMRRHPSNAVACGADDLNFHAALAQATHNPLYPALLGSLNDLLRRYFELSHHGKENALRTARQHETILGAVRKGDATRAAKAMKLHLQASETDLGLARRKRRLNSKAGG